MLTPEQYAIQREICDIANRYWQENATHGKTGSSMSAELAAHPDYAACNNEMRGRVEQYEILRDLPDTIFAYIGSDPANYPIETWTGNKLSTNLRCTASWFHNGRRGVRMHQYVATIGGQRYKGRSQGAGMCIKLRKVKP